MNPFKNFYNAVAVFLTIRHRDKSKFISFEAIKLQTQIFILCLIPLVLTIVLIKKVTNFITDKDKDDSIRNSGKIMAVYAQTSEYEYRSATDVFARIVKNCITKITNGVEFHDNEIIRTEAILEHFFAFQGRLYQIRPETKEEFVTRRIEEEIRQYSEANKPELEKLFQAQYDIIIEKSSGDILKAFYLGLDVLAKKLPIGNSKKQTPPQSTKEVPQPN